MERRTNLDYLIKIAILGAISGAIMMLKIKIPIFPFFLSLDFSDIPGVVGALVFGPLAGVLIQAIKIASNLLFQGSFTFGVGELANFLSGISFVLPLAFIYKLKPNLKGVIYGGIAGTLATTLVMCVSNYWFFIPLYAKAFKTDVQYFVDIASMLPVLGKYIHDLKDMILINFLPFNLLKGFLVTCITLLSYKFLVPPLVKIQNRR